MDIESILRKEIEGSGKTLRELGEAVGVKQPVLSQFMKGTGLQTRTVKKLMKYFGLIVVKK